MKKLTLVNVDDLILSALQEHYDVVEEISEHMFIDWHNPKQDLVQINMLEESIKLKSKIVLFDRYLTLKQHEVDWLLRYNNVYLFEPCLITRKGFQYMPFWYKSHEPFEDGLDKHIDVGVVTDINRTGIKYEYNIPTHKSYRDINMTVLFCSDNEYNRGYLPDMNSILCNACVPLLPGKHKYFWRLFSGLIVDSKKDLDWCTNVLRLYDALIYGIYDTMENYFPEMLVENVARQIKLILK